MKEKILSLIHKKLTTEFKTKFLSKQEFESNFKQHAKPILDLLTSLIKTYAELIDSRDPEVIKVSKADYVKMQFCRRHNIQDVRYYEQIFACTRTREADVEAFEKNYEYYIARNNNEFVVCLIDYLLQKTEKRRLLKEGESPLSIPYMFWKYFEKQYTEGTHYKKYEGEELMKSPISILQKFEKEYLSNPYLQLLELASKELEDVTFSPFDPFVVNVGSKSYELGRAGWTTFNYKILNNGKQHTYSLSLKDEKATGGEFVNIFVFQSKYLIKFSITLQEVEVNRFIIYRDCEKVAVKNECEVVISKHHGNETIVFDTKKEAVACQIKLLEMREGRLNTSKR